VQGNNSAKTLSRLFWVKQPHWDIYCPCDWINWRRTVNCFFICIFWEWHDAS